MAQKQFLAKMYYKGKPVGRAFKTSSEASLITRGRYKGYSVKRVNTQQRTVIKRKPRSSYGLRLPRL